jgi:hypothetical protein
MGVIGDTVGEFKKAGTGEKIFIIGGGLAALAIALYLRGQSKSSTGGTPVASTTGSTGMSTGGIQTVPTSSGGNVPILPPGLNPIFDNSGNLLGYQPIQQQPAPITNPTGGGNTIIPFGSLPSDIPWKTGQKVTYGGKTYTMNIGAQGRIWDLQSGKLLYQLQPLAGGGYTTGSASIPKQGGGPYGTSVLGVHGQRIAPTTPHHIMYNTHATRIYSLRGRP